MKSVIKKILISLFPKKMFHYGVYRDLIKNQNSYLYLTGWIQSLEANKSMDAEGNPTPWMNFPVIKLLEEKLKPDLNLFEYGSGYSTYFYANKVKSVVSVEYDKKWFDLIKSKLPSNTLLIFKAKDIDGNYCRVIRSMEEKYDVVIVDGRDRVNCVKQSILALSSKGIVLLDDSQRENYQEAFNFAKNEGFKMLNLEGLKATGFGIDRATIFYREGNCLEI